jgi:nucleoside-diphosphate-sugar epimerase
VASEVPGLRKFVFLSSLSATGPAKEGRPVDEETPASPVSHYGKSKLAAEQAVLKHIKERGLPAVIIRPPAVYGPRDRGFRVFFRMISRGVFPDWGPSRYSLIYVDDLVRGIVAAAHSPHSAGDIFFLADDQPYTSREIVQVMAEACSKKPLRVPIPRFCMPVVAGLSELSGRESFIINRDKLREIRHRNWVCDPARAKRELGFAPKTKLKEGIKWTADWYRIHRWL